MRKFWSRIHKIFRTPEAHAVVSERQRDFDRWDHHKADAASILRDNSIRR